MTGASTSTLSWLDSSEHERRTVLELVSALNEPGTLDELGIGSIRDTISDELFPGTSTIQTRARYFLFVPWIMQMVEASSTSNPSNQARRVQLQLCNALVRSHGSDPGVIGRQAGAALQRWPLDIYWLGMARWGIRSYPGSISSYFETLRRPSSWHMVGRALEEPVEGRRDEAFEGVPGNWASLPGRPPGFPEEASFTLTAEEGRYLRERVVLSNPQSYLAHVLQTGRAEESMTPEFPWDHPAAETAPESVRAWLNDAQTVQSCPPGRGICCTTSCWQNYRMTRPAERNSRTGSPTGPMRWPPSPSTCTAGTAPPCGVDCCVPIRGCAPGQGSSPTTGMSWYRQWGVAPSRTCRGPDG